MPVVILLDHICLHTWQSIRLAWYYKILCFICRLRLKQKRYRGVRLHRLSWLVLVCQKTTLKSRELNIRFYCFPFSEVDRAIADGDTAGMAKIITNPRGKLLGACIVGPHAGELIAEYSLAITQGMKVSALSKTIHIYPTLAQINRRVADQRMKALLTPARKRWLLNAYLV